MKKNGILTFLFAFVPGAGQMYQGYMKRGLSLITLFFLCIMAGMLLLEQLVLTALIVWMYSFFDTFNLRAQFIAGTAPADDYLVHFNTKDARLTLFFRDSHKLVGWALIALGAMVAYQNIIMRVLGDVMWRWGQNNPFFRAVYLMLSSCLRSWSAWPLSSAVRGWCAAPRAKRCTAKRQRNRRTRTSASTPQPKPMHRKPRRKPQTLPCRSSALCWATR